MSDHTPFEDIKHKSTEAGQLMLECGHKQRVSDWRIRLASEGKDQHMIWCVVCDDWKEPT